MFILLLMFFKKWACYICMVGGMIVKHKFFYGFRILRKKNWVLDFF